MQKGDKKDTKMATPVEIVDAPPRVTGNETILKTNNISEAIWKSNWNK